MPAPIPCPNPNCGQLLAVESIQGTGKVACPRCGTVLQFRPSPAANAPTGPMPVPPPPAIPPTIPMAQPVPPRPPVVPPVPAVPPVPQAGPPAASNVKGPPTLPGTAPPVLHDEDEEDDEEPEHNPHLAFNQPSVGNGEGGDSPIRRPRRKKSIIGFLIVAPLVMLAISTTLFFIWLGIRHVLSNPELLNEDAFVSRIENAYFPVLRKPWAQYQTDVDRALAARGEMAVNYVACRSSPNSAVALYHRDYRTRLPGEGELLDIGLTKLRGDRYGSARGYFTGVEWERVEGDFTLAGQPALRLNFEGVDGENVVSSGEVWCMASNGVGYWLFFWAPKSERTEQIDQEWEEIRKRFSLGEKRRGWVETVIDPQLKRIPDTNYEFKYPGANLWELREEDGWDPSASVVLIAYERDSKNRPPIPSKRYAGKMAVLQVLRLAAVATPEAALESAKAHLLEQQKQENPETRMEVMVDKNNKPREGTAQIGSVEGLITHLEIIPDVSVRKRYFQLAVIPDAGGVLVFQFGCNYDRAVYWETEFASILKTLRNFKNP